MYLFGKRSSSSQRCFFSAFGRFGAFVYRLSCPLVFVYGRYVLPPLLVVVVVMALAVVVVDGVVVVRVNGIFVISV